MRKCKSEVELACLGDKLLQIRANESLKLVHMHIEWPP